MFGLMRAKTCALSEAEKHFRRLHYCGTCKTIGSLYGQKSRLLLNHDTVFLAELLTALSGDDIRDWQKSYQSYNCLNLPKSEIPASLQFAATANVILAEFKLADHAADEGKRRYKFAQKAFTGEFEKAENLLKTWNFPFEKVKELLRTQPEREAESLSLEDLAEPTARTTAEFFAHGVGWIGKSELQDLAREIGLAFGKLIYILDAFEDYERDFREKQFNALRAVFQSNESRIPAEIKGKVFTILRELESGIVAKIYELPIAQKQKALFASRLESNLRRKLETRLPVLKAEKVCRAKAKQTFSQKCKNASQTAKDLARNYSWRMPLVFLFVFVFALVAPAQTKEAKSARECFDLSFNLMTLSAIFGSILTLPKSILTQIPEDEKRKAEQGAGESVGEDAAEGCCDACECCCCESCGGGDGGGGWCGNCDCCSGCCDNCCCDCSCD